MRSAVALWSEVKEREAAAVVPMDKTRALTSPWAAPLESGLISVVVDDVWGYNSETAPPRPLTRDDGMGVPAAARARNLLCADLAGAPLWSYTGATRDAKQPVWLQRTDAGESPWQRMNWTADDLIWHGWSLWAVRRDGEGQVAMSARVPYADWDWNAAGAITYLGEEVEDDAVVLIPGPHEGVLNMKGGMAVRSALELEHTVNDWAGNPVPTVELHQTTPDSLTDTERRQLVDHWRVQRRKRGGTIAYTPMSMEARIHGVTDGPALIESRNAAAVNVVRQIGVDAGMVDASGVNSTLTYETREGRDLGYVQRSLRLYAGPIAARLSMDDVIPRGRRIAFDFTDMTIDKPDPTGPATED